MLVSISSRAAQWGLHMGARAPPLHLDVLLGGPVITTGVFQMKLETQG